MKKLLFIILACVALACGEGTRDNNDSNSKRSDEREAATEDDVDIGSGEAISPQLELDSADDRFEVDTVSSSAEAERESEDDSF
jgi:hypothetical protein